MTIEKAKKILNKEYENLTDNEVELRIKRLRVFARVLVDSVIKKHCKMNYSDEKSNNFS